MDPPDDADAGDSSENIEQVGAHFSIDGMREVRGRTRQAIDAIAQRLQPGMLEERAIEIARQTLKDLGLIRGWHEVVVRFGVNTVREYGNPSAPSVVLGTEDIFFIDIGPVWKNCEGDGGASFVVGSDPEMRRAARDVVTLWHRVHEKWRAQALTGRHLYEFALAEAATMGWELNLKRMSGHRIGDFPHRHRFRGLLSSVDVVPSAYLWILEIHIRHRTRQFGAFYEDLMVPEDSCHPA
jgi:methionyl aminopeptidase